MKNTEKPARPVRSGRRPGPSSTREEILRAARRCFAELGYDRATFRKIATRAGVDPALVVQFFGSKSELFVAATTSPVTLAEMSVASEDGDPGKAGLRLARLFMLWLEDTDAREAMLARIRSAATEPAAAGMVREMVMGQLVPFARLIGGDRPEARASMLASQLVGMVWARYVVPLEPLASMSGEEVAAWLGPALQVHLAPGAEP
jgi:AcrR family transcriptional regulator